MDELQEEFSTYYIPPRVDNKYGYNAGSYPNSVQQDNYYPEPIHIPKPHYSASTVHNQEPENTYIPPTFSQVNISNGFQGYPDRRQPLPLYINNKYISKSMDQGQQHSVYRNNVNLHTREQYPPHFNQNDLWNR